MIIEGTRSGSWPVVTADVKTQLVIPSADTSYDSEIDDLIEAACIKFEKDTGKYLRPIAIEARYTTWPSYGFKLLFGPVTACDIKYRDENDSEQTVSNDSNEAFYIRSFEYETEIAFKLDWTKPDTSANFRYPIELEITAGYASASDVPKNYQQAVKVLAAHLFEERLNGVSEKRTLYDNLINTIKICAV